MFWLYAFLTYFELVNVLSYRLLLYNLYTILLQCYIVHFYFTVLHVFNCDPSTYKFPWKWDLQYKPLA